MKNILITGASRGIGYAVAERFLNHGHTVTCASRNTDALQDLKQNYGDHCNVLALDLEDIGSIKSFVKKIIHKKFDVVIHNSGYLVNKPFTEIAHDDLMKSYRVNVLGPFQLQQAIMPLLTDQAHTVFISSIGGFQGSVKFPGLSAYSTSKAAVVSLTELLQEEYKDSELAFNCICLGAVQTEMLENAFPGYRAPLNPEEVAEYICHYSLTASRFMKGKVIPLSLSTP